MSNSMGAGADGSPMRRSRDDRWLLGICGGFARHFGAASWLVRLLWVLSLVVTLGLSAVAYFLLALVIPDDADQDGA